MLIDKRQCNNTEFVFLLHTVTDDQMTLQVHMDGTCELTVKGTWWNEYGAVYLVAMIDKHSDSNFVGRSVRFLDQPKTRPTIPPNPDVQPAWTLKLRPFVYIAAPFTLGDNALNIRNAMDAAEQLIAVGALPFNPLLLNAHYIVHHHSWGEAMQICFSYLAKCDMVWRIPGKSKGADEECQLADRLNIPVFSESTQLFDAIDLMNRTVRS